MLMMDTTGYNMQKHRKNMELNKSIPNCHTVPSARDEKGLVITHMDKKKRIGQ